MINLIKKTIRRFMDKQFIRFVFVGGLNTIVSFGSYALFIKVFGINYVVASFIYTVIGVTNSYLWNKYFTFKIKKMNIFEFLRFISVYAISYVINVNLLIILVEIFKFDPIIANVLLLVVTMLISFVGHKLWSFRSFKKKTDKVG
jgi:putative flippase GtrA